MSELRQIDYGGKAIPFKLQRNERKRLRIEVHPDSSVVVLAPIAATTDVVLSAIQRKARWIVRQQRYFQQYEPRATEREYVSGETHLYLGRRYRLRVRAVDDTPGVKLNGRYICVYCQDASDAEEKGRLLRVWYRRHAERIFVEVLDDLLAHKKLRALPAPQLAIRSMKKRWGSCTHSGRIVLNAELIRAPRRCIEYVVAHELCHLLVPSHSSQFTRLLASVIPDWKRRKELLERSLA